MVVVGIRAIAVERVENDNMIGEKRRKELEVLKSASGNLT